VNLRIYGRAFGLGLSFVWLVVELGFDVSVFCCLSLPVLCLLYNTSKREQLIGGKALNFGTAESRT
jgi:hypothetical protein